MKNLLFASIILTITIFFSCGGGEKDASSEKESAAEQVIPDDREFSPFDIGEAPVNGKNLAQQIQLFYTSILDKEIGVIIAPDFGYLQKGINIRFDEMGVRGEYGPFGMRRSFDDPARNLEMDYKDQFLVFKGKLWFDILKGNDVNLLDAYFVSTYQGEEITENRTFTWDDLTIENPVLPGEIMQMVAPLKGIEVTLTDKVFIDDYKNYVLIRDDDSEDEIYITCHFSDREELESVKKDRVYTIKGFIDEINLEDGHVWLTDCQLVK